MGKLGNEAKIIAEKKISPSPVLLGWHGWPPAEWGRLHPAQRRRTPLERECQTSAQWYGHMSAERKPAEKLRIVRHGQRCHLAVQWCVQWWRHDDSDWYTVAANKYHIMTKALMLFRLVSCDVWATLTLFQFFNGAYLKPSTENLLFMVDTYNCWIQAPEVEGVNPHFLKLCVYASVIESRLFIHCKVLRSKYNSEGHLSTVYTWDMQLLWGSNACIQNQ